MISREDFKLNIQPKWCPGCGSHAILMAMQSALPEITESPNNVVFVSGIGCSSRFPYYINTYGFHTIHGRALPVATGIKLSNPELNVWVITGDGDLLAIGGNHFIHLLRRNINLKIVLFNNFIYALTKGQFSPTTKKGTITKSSPDGTVENPFNVAELAIGAKCSFFARAIDNEIELMKKIFIEAARHNGTSVIEILHNCVIFNNQSKSKLYQKQIKNDYIVYLEKDKPLIFGNNMDKGIFLKDNNLIINNINENNKDKVIVHNPNKDTLSLHLSLGSMNLPDFPVALGVLRSVKYPVYEDILFAKTGYKFKKLNNYSLNKLFKGDKTLEIK
jgi:2-oxoglutarate ferredoxin oxidoreductase subunit beta